jgi:hypothetical protein
MIKALRSFRGGYVVFLLFGLALVLRSWSLTLVLTLGLYVFWRSRVEQKKEKRPKLTEEVGKGFGNFHNLFVGEGSNHNRLGAGAFGAGKRE